MRDPAPVYATLVGLLVYVLWRADSMTRYIFAPWLPAVCRITRHRLYRLSFRPLGVLGMAVTVLATWATDYGGAAPGAIVLGALLTLAVNLLIFPSLAVLLGWSVRSLVRPLMRNQGGRRVVGLLLSPILAWLPRRHPVWILLLDVA